MREGLLEEQVLNLSREALNGRLNLTALLDRWPSEAHQHPVLSAVYDDVEDAVEHFPGSPWTGQPLWEEWWRSQLYRRLVVDVALLEAGTQLSGQSFLDARRRLARFIDNQEVSSEELVRLTRETIVTA